MQKISIQMPEKSFPVQEAIKTLRSNIDFSGENIKSVCVTGALPGDGKSTISYELPVPLPRTAGGFCWLTPTCASPS